MLSREDLLVVARHSRLVDVPAGRWLVRRGRAVQGSHFLVRGIVRTVAPDGVIEARHLRARDALYPGVQGLVTLTDCRLLQVRDGGLDLLGAGGRPGFVTVVDGDDCWQSRFLSSHLMTALPATCWQRVLSRLERCPAANDETLIAEGQSASLDRCFILARGRALVIRQGRTLSALSPGDLFGEDALISARPRNATVRMVESGVVMMLRAQQFQQFLNEVLNCGGFGEPAVSKFSNAPREDLTFGSVRGIHEKISELDGCVTYFVESASEEVAALALFLMRKRGLKAWAVPPLPH